MQPNPLIMLLCCITLTTPSAAKALEFIDNYIPDAKISGSDRYSYVFFDVYDVTLFAPSGQWTKSEPFALSLKYLRKLKGKRIANSSIQEIRSQGLKDEVKLASWYSQMKEIFPDVQKGSTLTGIHLPGQETRFYYNDTRIGTIKDPEFGHWFFGIWLAETTRAPALKQKLTGAK